LFAITRRITGRAEVGSIRGVGPSSQVLKRNTPPAADPCINLRVVVLSSSVLVGTVSPEARVPSDDVAMDQVGPGR
jgi:hypothetical protein